MSYDKKELLSKKGMFSKFSKFNWDNVEPYTIPGILIGCGAGIVVGGAILGAINPVMVVVGMMGGAIAGAFLGLLLGRLIGIFAEACRVGAEYLKTDLEIETTDKNYI